MSFAPGRVDQVSVANALRNLLGRVRSLEAVAPPTGGSGFQFNAGTYGADNVGDYSLIEATGFSAIDFSQPHSTFTADVENFSMGINTANGILFTCDPANINNTGNPAVTIEYIVQTGGFGAYGLNILATDNTTGGSGPVTGAVISASGKTSAGIAGLFSHGVGIAGSSGDVYGIQASGKSSGSGREIGLSTQTGGGQTGANSLALLCSTHLGAAIFEVRDDGSVHIKTGTAVIADL